MVILDCIGYTKKTENILKMNTKIFTIGHSTHSQQEYVDMLKGYNIKKLVDVRSYPGSRYMPHFNRENMTEWMKDTNIQYLHMPSLGGRRRVLDSIDEALINGWDNIAFKNYAAYTLTAEYENAIKELIVLATKHRVCYMCAESVPWRCHRLLISNTLVSKGMQVYHIINQTQLIEHKIGLYGAKPLPNQYPLIYPKLS